MSRLVGTFRIIIFIGVKRMVIYVTVVTFLMPLLMNKFLSVVIPHLVLLERTKVWYILHPIIFVMKSLHE